ncbi:HipA domain-containing protein [Rheinheimera riviphila]|nr:HipA domain-containing protein [Rheinheimera riviphila]
MQQLCLQIYLDGVWQDAMQLEFAKPDAGRFGPVKAAYNRAFTARYFQQTAAHQVCCEWPIELLAVYRHPQWPAFLDDIMPAGAGRRLWVKELALEHLSGPEQDFQLLRHGTIAPIGHLRIKESVQFAEQQLNTSLQQLRFSAQHIIERDADFLHYARQMGAISGGATGAGGEAPKLLIRQNLSGEVWLDPLQHNQQNPDQHFLVKYARGQRTEIDKEILRAEYHYYQELHALGIHTIDVQQMKLEEGTHTPSLWLPRFDRPRFESPHSAQTMDTATPCGTMQQRLAMESVYSLHNKTPAAIWIITKCCKLYCA